MIRSGGMRSRYRRIRQFSNRYRYNKYRRHNPITRVMPPFCCLVKGTDLTMERIEPQLIWHNNQKMDRKIRSNAENACEIIFYQKMY